MARKTSQTLTEGEQRIMRILWSEGALSVRQVSDILNKDHKVAYTTVQTVLNVLERKNYVTSKKDGRAYIYSSLVSKREAQTEALKSLVQQFFNGSEEALAQHLLQESDIDLMAIDELKEITENDNDEVSS